MAEKIKIPKSVKKFIRKEKARIKREILDVEEQAKAIAKLYERVLEQLKKKKSSKEAMSEKPEKKKVEKNKKVTKQSSKIKPKELVKT